MLDPDISTAGALRHLRRPDPAVAAGDADGLHRRRFLQLVGAGLGATLAVGPGSSLLDAVLGGDVLAWAAGPIGAHDGVLVVLGLFGGNDGLNTIVPITDGHYYDQHAELALPAASTLPLDGATGLHPELVELKRFWDAGQLAVVEGVGHGVDDFSHFSSMAKWMAGRPTGIPDSGWIGRWLDDYLASGPDLFAAAEIGHSLPLHMVGDRSVASTVPVGQPDFGIPREWRPDADEAFFDAIRALGTGPGPTWARRVGQAQADQLRIAKTLAPVLPDDEPSGEPIVQQMEIAARLINANLGFRVLSVGYGDFDSHAGQADMHTARMVEMNDAVRRFFQLLDPRWATRVTVATYSEFGRTSYAGDGTDHGSSGPQLVFGANVRGGFHGQRPTLAGLRRWDRMATHVDLRDYYGSLIDGWLGGGGSAAVPGYDEDLRLFRNGPGRGDAAVPDEGSSNVVVGAIPSDALATATRMPG